MDKGYIFDPETAKFLERLTSSANPLGDTLPIIQIGNQPGIVYLMGGYQPGTAMYISMPYDDVSEPMNLEYNIAMFRQIRSEIKTSVVILNQGINPVYLQGTADEGGLDLDKNPFVD